MAICLIQMMQHDENNWDDILKGYREAHYFLSPQTLSVYGWTMDRVIRTLNSTGPAEVTTGDILRFMSGYAGRSASTWNVNLSAIKSFFDWAAESRRRRDNPAAALRYKPMGALPEVRVLEREEVVKLAAVERINCAIAVFLCNTGLRASEFCGLTARTVDRRRHCVTVLGKGSKPRTIPLNHTAMGILERWGDIFKPTGRSMRRQALAIRLKRAARRAGVAQIGRAHV